MHYFICAGEPSGDLHASHLMAAIGRIDTEASFTFLGGDLMSEAAGKKPLIHYSRMAFMGFSEVLRNLRVIMGNFSRARKAIDSSRPDALILYRLSQLQPAAGVIRTSARYSRLLFHPAQSLGLEGIPRSQTAPLRHPSALHPPV